MFINKDPEVVTELSPGGIKRANALIKLIQTDEHSEFRYQIKMKNHPEGTVTWTETKYRDDFAQYIQVSENKNHKIKYQKGGQFWGDTLFSFKGNVQGRGAILLIMYKYFICISFLFIHRIITPRFN